MNSSEPREYGGYFELECARFAPYHEGGVFLNSARNALRYLIRMHDIQRIALPYYTCPVVFEAVREEACAISFYDVTSDLEPDLSGLDPEAFAVCNNYFGIRTSALQALASARPNLLIDQAQSFYAPPSGLGSFYSPRKFFGLPDGGIAFCHKTDSMDLEIDHSYGRCSHLLKRHDLGANAAYPEFSLNDRTLDGAPLRRMSRLTRALMGNLDHERIKKARRKNYQVLHQALSPRNRLNAELSEGDVPLVYPFVTEDEGLRERLIERRVYVARYWPELEFIAPKDSCASYFQRFTLPLPVDQRYTPEDMRAILHILKASSKGGL